MALQWKAQTRFPLSAITNSHLKCVDSVYALEVIRDTDHRPTTNSQCAKTFRFDVCDGEVVV